MGDVMMITRRRFLSGVGAGVAYRFWPGATVTTMGAQTPAASAPSPDGLTVIAYNVMKCVGWPEGYAKKRLRNVVNEVADRTALALAAYKPDIVSFSEAPAEHIARRISERLGMHYAYFPSGELWPGTVFTRFEILGQRNCPIASGTRPKPLFTRHWGCATLKTASGDLVVHSAHLHPFDVGVRKQEVAELLKIIEPSIKAGRSVLFQGDLNHTPVVSTYEAYVKAGLVDTQAAAGDPAQPTIRSDKPRNRIDYIFAGGPIAKRVKECRVLFEGPFRTDPADPQSFALSDHLPVMARFTR